MSKREDAKKRVSLFLKTTHSAYQVSGKPVCSLYFIFWFSGCAKYLFSVHGVTVNVDVQELNIPAIYHLLVVVTERESIQFYKGKTEYVSP